MANSENKLLDYGARGIHLPGELPYKELAHSVAVMSAGLETIYPPILLFIVQLWLSS